MPNVWIKQGVLGRLSPDMRRVKGRLVALYFGQGKDFYITSLCEGNHMSNSCHYEGDAIDFKRQGMPAYKIELAAGESCDVVEYTDERDIFHVEFDPPT